MSWVEYFCRHDRWQNLGSNWLPSNFPHMSPRKVVVFNYWTLVSDDLIILRDKSYSKTSWTSTMRCFVGRIMKKKHTFSTVPRFLRTRTQIRELDLEEVGCWLKRSELCVREKTVCHFSWLHSLSFIKISCYACSWVWKWGPHKCLGISSMLSVSEVCKNKL